MKCSLQAITVAMVMASLGLLVPKTIAADEHAPRKAVLVTGASSGIGLKITEVLSANDFYVYAGARKPADLGRLDAMENVSSVRLDVTVQEEIEAAVRFVEDQGRGLWGIVNNAGVGLMSPLVDGPVSDLELTFAVNVYGPYRVNQAFLPLVMESGGRTTTISSISAFIASPADGGYSASKVAVEGYSDALAIELHDSGVHVSVVQPGGYRSEIRRKALEHAVASDERGEMELSAEARKGLEDWVASNETLKEPYEVAAAVLHAMSSGTPKRRYMVTPNERQANFTIRSALRRVVELNEDQVYTYDRDELVAMLDELLEAE